eukprot:3339997-Rhodomonas_salina.2
MDLPFSELICHFWGRRCRLHKHKQAERSLTCVCTRVCTARDLGTGLGAEVSQLSAYARAT